MAACAGHMGGDRTPQAQRSCLAVSSLSPPCAVLCRGILRRTHASPASMSSVRAAANSISLSMNHTARRRASAAWATRNGFQGSAADAGEVSSSGSSRIAGKMALSLEPARPRTTALA